MHLFFSLWHRISGFLSCKSKSPPLVVLLGAMLWPSWPAAAQTVAHKLSGISSFDPDVHTFDLLVTLTRAYDDWLDCGIDAVTFNGVAWFYSLSDPNAFPTAPGTGTPEKYATFVNPPRSQFANARFTSPATIMGSYVPISDVPIITPTHLDLLFNEMPPDPNTPDPNSAVARLSLDLRSTSYVGWSVSTAESAGAIKLAQIDVGTVTMAFGPHPVTKRFELWATAPEPSAFVLLFAGIALCRCTSNERKSK